jgi:DNA-binding MarR family transcriptional regulator
LLQERGWVEVEHQGSNPRWKQMVCRITPAGRALHRKVMPQARRAQAAMIRRMSAEERVVVYRALKMLRAIGEALEANGDGRVAE